MERSSEVAPEAVPFATVDVVSLAFSEYLTPPLISPPLGCGIPERLLDPEPLQQGEAMLCNWWNTSRGTDGLSATTTPVADYLAFMCDL